MLNTTGIDKHVSSCLLFMPINNCTNDSINSILLPTLVGNHHYEHLDRLNNDNNSIRNHPNTSSIVDSSVAAIISSSSIASISIQRDDLQQQHSNNIESTTTNSNTTSLLGSIITHQQRGGGVGVGIGDDSDDDDIVVSNRNNNTDIPRFIDINVSNKRSKNDTSYIQLCFDPINNAMATEWVGQPRMCTINSLSITNQSTSTVQQKVQQGDTSVSLTQNDNCDVKQECGDSIKVIDCDSTYVFGSFDPFSFDDVEVCESNDSNNNNDIVPIEWVIKEFDPISAFTNLQHQQQQQHFKKRGYVTINNNNKNKNKNKSKRTINRHKNTRRFCSITDIDNDSTSMTSNTKSQDYDDVSNPITIQSNNNNNHNNWAQWGRAFSDSSIHTTSDANRLNDTSNSTNNSTNNKNNNDMKFVNENWFVDLSDLVGDTLLLLSSTSNHDVKYCGDDDDDDYTTTTTTRNDSYYNIQYDIVAKTSSSCSGLSCIRSITTIFVSNVYDDDNKNKMYYTPTPTHKIYNPITLRPNKSSNRYTTTSKVDRTITAKYSKLSFG